MSQVQAVCSVSGGSITSGVLATRWNQLKSSQQNGIFQAFDELIARPIIAFCKQDLRTSVLLWDRVNPIRWPQLMRSDYSVTDRLATRYAEDLDLGVRFDQLPKTPSFIFCATNLENGTCWTFNQEQMGDWY